MKIKTLLFATLFLAFGQVALAQSQTFDLNQGDFTEGFENGVGNWRLSNLLQNTTYGVISTVKFQSQYYPMHHSGEYCFRFCSSGVNPGFMVSPTFEGTENGIHVEFYYNAFYNGVNYSFTIGTVTNLENISGSFQALETVNVIGELTTGQNPWIKYENDFYGVDNIAIKVQSSSVFVDDIAISQTVCGKPMVTSSSTTFNSMTLNWLGSSDSYEMQYIPFEFHADFEEGMEGWTSFDNAGFTNTWARGDAYQIDNPRGVYSVYSSLVNEEDNYLVSPWTPLEGELSFYAKYEYGDNDIGFKGESLPVHFKVYVYLTSVEGIGAGDIVDFEEVGLFSANDYWYPQSIDLSAYTGQMGYVIICHIYEEDSWADDVYYLEIDDISLLNSNGEWTTVAGITSPYSQGGLMPETSYAVQLRGDCGAGEYSSWSATTSVTTGTAPDNAKTFVGGQGDNWNVAANWSPSGVPTMDDIVFVKANAVIPAGFVAEALSVSVQPGMTLTIEEGGQLKHDNTGVMASVSKSITPYTGQLDQYYLVAMPVASVTPTTENGFLTTKYDLYSFDQVGDAEGMEWLNYEVNSFDLVSGMGYLYASNTATTLTVNGQLTPSTDAVVPMTYSDGAGFAGWNLVGNPFMCDAYIGREYYRLTEGELEIQPALASTPIAPMEGVFVKAADADDNVVSFTRTNTLSESVLNLNVTSQGDYVDMARICFGQGRGLEKFQLNPSHTKVYLQVGDQDYAVACTDGTMGEMPIGFKTAENGSYTISFNNENVAFSYLHLIDNLTGNDIDLLANPSYTFESRFTDYAQRFRLVYSTGSSADTDNFAFIDSNGNIIISGAEAGSTMQIVDVTGRIIVSRDAAHVSTKGMAHGVYVLRLINGENVKMQKFVVK